MVSDIPLIYATLKGVMGHKHGCKGDLPTGEALTAILAEKIFPRQKTSTYFQ